ncbi:Alkylmercury lyase (plasmid) [Rubrobacter radiotolerans]|uniref:Alkylmercury lyase n=1 Tax=Rubrobacter radiotolerans TaxID=42256 RepID=A0A023X767_RUBRA|nr:organomercurial lyase [Rubrobacter radiotolerans]AHY48168.1 Alkylmercury lyase [Rubrobacter radiotolerans]MDX5895427.1 organomercurial lyase [Rubrobacter radiotolerans]SMC01799.1 Alkylmercury lyase [Rubrobacter radiotolerans DSM 5868]
MAGLRLAAEKREDGGRPRAIGCSYWANCAWDMLGVAAALHDEAELEAEYAEDASPAHLSVDGGRLGGEAAGVFHFPLPLRRRYDDLVFA